MSRTFISTVNRRQWLQWSLTATAGASAPWLAANAALPQDFLTATKPITIVVGGPAGGATDGVARVLAQTFSSQLGREVIVENKP
ncbi:MAG: ABC transporter substrate-binding protein, partial [Comamonas sp.]